MPGGREPARQRDLVERLEVEIDAVRLAVHAHERVPGPRRGDLGGAEQLVRERLVDHRVVLDHVVQRQAPQAEESLPRDDLVEADLERGLRRERAERAGAALQPHADVVGAVGPAGGRERERARDVLVRLLRRAPRGPRRRAPGRSPRPSPARRARPPRRRAVRRRRPTGRWASRGLRASRASRRSRSGTGPRCRSGVARAGTTTSSTRAPPPSARRIVSSPHFTPNGKPAAPFSSTRTPCPASVVPAASSSRWSARSPSSGSSVSSQPERSTASSAVFTSSTQSVPSQFTSLRTTAACAAPGPMAMASSSPVSHATPRGMRGS